MQTIYFKLSGIVVYTVIALLAVFNYYLLYPIDGFFDKIYNIILIIIILFIANISGKKVFNLLKLEFHSELEQNVFSIVLGYSLLMLLMFLLGVFSLYYKPVIWVLFFLIGILCYDEIVKLRKKTVSWIYVSAFLRHSSTVPGLIIIFFIFLSSLLMLINTFTPPTFYDSLVYHLSIPNIYIQKHGLCFIPFSLYSHFPQNIELLYVMGLLAGNDLFPNMISYSFGICLLFAIYSFCKTYLNDKQGILSVFLFATVPAVMLLSPSSYVEIGITLFTFIIIYAYFNYLHAEQDSQRIKWLVLLGFFSGITCGIKYTGFITVICINALFIAHMLSSYREEKIKTKIVHLLWYNLILLAAVSPWLIKNYINTGNPVFPFFYKVLGYKNVLWNMSTAQGYFAVLTEYSHKSSLLNELFRFPWQILNEPTRFGGGIDVLGDFGWVMFFVIIPAILLVSKKNDAVKLLLAYAVIHFSVWFITKPVLRFLVPVLPVLSVITGYVIIKLFENKVFVVRWVVHLILVLLTISNFYIFFYIQNIIDPYKVAMGIESKQEYLAKKLVYSPYPAFEFINNNLKDSDKILFLGEQRGFYCNKPYIATNAFAQNPFVTWADESADSRGLVTRLKQEQITHILYNKPEGERLRGYNIFNFTPQGEINWKRLLEYLKPVYADKNVCVYKIESN